VSAHLALDPVMVVPTVGTRQVDDVLIAARLVLRGALSNIARHANARHAAVDISVHDGLTRPGRTAPIEGPPTLPPGAAPRQCRRDGDDRRAHDHHDTRPRRTPDRNAPGVTLCTGPDSLTRADCLHLLGAGALGRVVFTASAMPAVQPVRYVLDGDDVVFHITDGGLLSTVTRHAVVGFQADDIDPVTHAGWTVLGVGPACEITAVDRRWVAGTVSETHAVVVALRQLSGHRVRLDTPGPRPEQDSRTIRS
jgi:hypothetical protein